MTMRTIKGKKWNETEMIGKPSDKHWPNVSIGLDVLPEAKEWKIGKTYTVTLKIRQTGMHMSKGGSGEHGSAQFDIVGIDPKGEAKGEKLKRYIDDE